MEGNYFQGSSYNAQATSHSLTSTSENGYQKGLPEDAPPTFILQGGNNRPIQQFLVDETENVGKAYIDSEVGTDEMDEDSETEQSNKIGNSTGKKTVAKKTRGRVKIKMEFIQNKLRRYTTFSKRKTGIMKKAFELSTLTGTQVMLLVASETGHVYTFATRKLQPMITSESGKALIQTCLNSPDPTPTTVQQTAPQNQIETVTVNPEVAQTIQPAQSEANEQRMSETGYEETSFQCQNNEEDAKRSQTSSASTPTIQYITPTTQSLPLNSYIVTQSGNKPVPVGSITHIYPAPSAAVGSSTQTVTLQPAQTAAIQQPQVIQGQLQLHKIHHQGSSQNYILTGNAPIQQSHIILNQPHSQPALIVSNTAAPATSTQRQETSTATQQQDVITFVSPGQNSQGQIVQVYNPSTGVIYAPAFKRIETSEQIPMQHTPVIQASSDVQQGTSVVISRQQLLDTELVVPRNPSNLSK